MNLLVLFASCGLLYEKPDPFLYQRSEDKSDSGMELRCLKPFSMESEGVSKASPEGLFTRPVEPDECPENKGTAR